MPQISRSRTREPLAFHTARRPGLITHAPKVHPRVSPVATPWRTRPHEMNRAEGAELAGSRDFKTGSGREIVMCAVMAGSTRARTGSARCGRASFGLRRVCHMLPLTPIQVPRFGRCWAIWKRKNGSCQGRDKRRTARAGGNTAGKRGRTDRDRSTRRACRHLAGRSRQAPCPLPIITRNHTLSSQTRPQCRRPRPASTSF
jgi:hypothetical protein